ncbi:MAG: dehydrogenase [Anaerolinea sp.]|nr:dehydrogenase [Anaerolinea sp.]
MAEFLMPSLGADMTEGTVTRWLVQPGDHVDRGDIVVEVETDKADMEVEIFEAGTIEQLLVPQGEKVPVGTPLAIVATAAAPAARVALPETSGPAPPLAEAPKPAAPSPAAPRPRATPTARIRARELGVDLAAVHGTGVAGAITRQDVEHAALRRAPEPAPRAEGRRLLVSPRARLLAGERGIDLATVTGSGPGGSITAGDVERVAAPTAVAAPSLPSGPAVEVPSGRPRAAGRGPIAALMERSNREIPHYYLGIEVDMSRALDWLKAENRKRPVPDRILASALLLKATALAAHEVPEVNGYFIDGGFQPSATVNLGVAISLRQGGLVAPAILDASAMPLGELMRRLQDLVARARAGRLRASEMSSGTITVTNLGEQGVDFVYGVIYPPQVALVGFGKVTERPWAEAGMLGVRPVITASLAADHRASDGHRGGQFLATVAKLLQEPEHL